MLLTQSFLRNMLEKSQMECRNLPLVSPAENLGLRTLTAMWVRGFSFLLVPEAKRFVPAAAGTNYPTSPHLTVTKAASAILGTRRENRPTSLLYMPLLYNMDSTFKLVDSEENIFEAVLIFSSYPERSS